MKSKLLLVLVAGIVTGASGCGATYPVCRVSVNGVATRCTYVPSIQVLNPSGAVAGGPGLTLNVQGSNFVAGYSVVRWNGSDRPTTVTPYNAIAQIPASDIAATGHAEITVFTPGPDGGTSNTVTFTIAAHGVYPSSVVVNPAGTFAYVTNSGSDNVSTYAVNTDRTLTFKATIAAGRNPVSIAVHSSGKFAYVANSGSNDVSTYVINTDGTLTFKGTIAAGTGPASAAVDPSGKFAYVANIGDRSISMYTINADGLLTSIGTINPTYGAASVTVHPSGKFAYVANGDVANGNISMYTIDATSGALTSAGTIAAGTVPVSVAVDPSGKFAYVANFGGDLGYYSGYDPGSVSMYTIDTTTGALMPNGEIGNGGGNTVVVDPSGGFAYATGGSNLFFPGPVSPSLVSEYTLNATTGVLASNGTAPTEQSPRSIAIAPSGKFAYVTNYDSHSISMYTIDAVTGTLTLIGTIIT